MSNNNPQKFYKRETTTVSQPLEKPCITCMDWSQYKEVMAKWIASWCSGNAETSCVWERACASLVINALSARLNNETVMKAALSGGIACSQPSLPCHRGSLNHKLLQLPRLLKLEIEYYPRQVISVLKCSLMVICPDNIQLQIHWHVETCICSHTYILIDCYTFS